VLGPCPSVYDCLWPSLSVLPASILRPLNILLSVCVCWPSCQSVCVNVLVGFLLFSKSNQLPNNSIQTLAARAMDKDMDMDHPPMEPPDVSPPNSSFPACSSVCCVSWRLRLAVIFTVKSICSRQKQHLILL